MSASRWILTALFCGAVLGLAACSSSTENKVQNGPSGGNAGSGSSGGSAGSGGVGSAGSGAGGVTGGAAGSGGAAGGNCAPGTADCDAANGCETTLATDVQHCGSCENACSAPSSPGTGAAACQSGVCTFTCNTGFIPCKKDCSATLCELIGGNPHQLAIDAGYVYWTDSVGGVVRRRPLSFADPEVELANNQTTPGDIAVDSNGDIFWCGSDKVQRREPNGTVSSLGDCSSSSHLAVSAGVVYWTVGNQGVQRCGATGANPSLSTLQGWSTGTTARQLSITDSFVYASFIGGGSPGGGAWRGMLDGSSASVLASPHPDANAITCMTGSTDDECWLGKFDSGFTTLHVVGTTSVEMGDGPEPTSLAHFAATLYWTGADSVGSATTDLVTFTPLETSQTTARSIAVDAKAMYWVRDGAIAKRPRP